MNKAIYQDIKSKVESVSSIRYFGIWNNQLARGHKMSSLPAVFVEFNPINWEDMNNYAQESETFSFNLHIIANVRNDNDLSVYDLSQDIHTALHKSYSRQREIPPHDWEGVADYTMTFTSRITDESVSDDSYYDDKPDNLAVNKDVQGYD